MLDLFSIRHIADRYPGIISGGEGQRAALARALVMQPEILLLDEPFSALDPTTKKRMYETLRDVHGRFRCTVVFVTHDFNEACCLGHRAGIILDGALQAVCPADELFTREFCPQVMAFLGRGGASCGRRRKAVSGVGAPATGRCRVRCGPGKRYHRHEGKPRARKRKEEPYVYPGQLS